MQKFKKRPVIIEAIQYTGSNNQEIKNILDEHQVEYDFYTDEDYLVIKTLEGNMEALLGDWIIKGTAGEFYPCKNNIFKEIYEEVFR